MGDLKPCYMDINGQRMKVTSYMDINGERVKISTAEVEYKLTITPRDIDETGNYTIYYTDGTISKS